MLTATAAVIAASSGNLLAKDGPILEPILAAVQGSEAKAAMPDLRAQGGPLGTMPHGRYQCALPGDAQTSAISVVEDEGFRISQASSYKSGTGGGIYLMQGKTLTFTRGPKKGERFERVGSNQLQKVNADGSLSKLICTRLGSAG
ncbi:MAG: elongation factor P [Pseudomonadota bacterium]